LRFIRELISIYPETVLLGCPFNKNYLGCVERGCALRAFLARHGRCGATLK
jgi:hypothetical protein